MENLLMLSSISVFMAENIQREYKNRHYPLL